MSPRLRRPVAAFDIDGTLMRKPLAELLCNEMFLCDIFPKEQSRRYAKLVHTQRDRSVAYGDFDRQFVTLFRKCIAGVCVKDVLQAAERVAGRFAENRFAFTMTLLKTLRDTHYCVAITGAPIEIVDILAPSWGFHAFAATRLEKRRGAFTGRDIDVPAKDKAMALRRLIGGDAPSGSIAVGDTGSDIPMLEAVEHAIAFNPDGLLAARSEEGGWAMAIERKDNIWVKESLAPEWYRYAITDSERAAFRALH